MGLDRRAFLTAAGAAACTALPQIGRAQPAPRRIDVHRHLSPPFYADAVRGRFTRQFPPPLASWTPESCLADMDAAGIELGILSMPARPGMYFGDVPAARTLCRQANDYMASLRRRFPGRFGFFAALPLPDVEGSLTELAYALDTLHADGIGVWSSYGTTYLGDPKLAPLWDALEPRHGVVFVHPTDAACCANPVPVMSETVVEFGAETARTIGSLVFSGTSGKYRNLSFIFSHGGGVTPFVIDRFLGEARDPKVAALFPAGIEAELRKFYYDTAFVSTPEAMAALLKLVPSSHVVFGTDHPYRPSTATVDELRTSAVSAADLATLARSAQALVKPPTTRAS